MAGKCQEKTFLGFDWRGARAPQFPHSAHTAIGSAYRMDTAAAQQARQLMHMT